MSKRFRINSRTAFLVIQNIWPHSRSLCRNDKKCSRRFTKRKWQREKGEKETKYSSQISKIPRTSSGTSWPTRTVRWEDLSIQDQAHAHTILTQENAGAQTHTTLLLKKVRQVKEGLKAYYSNYKKAGYPRVAFTNSSLNVANFIICQKFLFLKKEKKRLGYKIIFFNGYSYIPPSFEKYGFK